MCKISYKTNNIAKGSGSAGGVGAGCGGGDSHSVLVQKAIPAPAVTVRLVWGPDDLVFKQSVWSS